MPFVSDIRASAKLAPVILTPMAFGFVSGPLMPAKTVALFIPMVTKETDLVEVVVPSVTITGVVALPL